MSDPRGSAPLDAGGGRAPARAGGGRAALRDEVAAAVPTAGPLDTLRTLTDVLIPTVARGAIIRRPRVVNLLQALDADTRAVARLRRLRERYGPGPVQLRLPGRRLTFLLEPDQAVRVLAESPEPFHPATREKRGALGHFEPEGVLISGTAERALRRPLNDAVLEPGRTVHEHGARMAAIIEEETEALLGHVRFAGVLDWDAFVATWMRIVRRIVLGDPARDDQALTDDLAGLRRDANWSFFARRRTAVRDRFLARLGDYVDRAEEGSLVAMLAAAPAPPGSEPLQQVPQWLFAFDAGAMASYRALALLATFPEAAARVRAEADGAPDLPYTRACVLESLRLWPTTPVILRDTTAPTRWAGGELAAGASVVLFATYFHRDESRFTRAHAFAPEIWLQERTAEDWPLVPFSAGPAMCPGRNVVLLVGSTVLTRLLGALDVAATGTPLHPDRPMPGTLSPFTPRFAATPRP